MAKHDIFSEVYRAVSRFRIFIASGILIMTVIGVLSLKFVNFDNDIRIMLPDESSVTKAINFLRESDISDKVIISLSLTKDKYPVEDLLAATDRFAGSLDAPFIDNVLIGDTDNTFFGSIPLMVRYFPQLFDTSARLSVKRKLSEHSLKDRVRTIYRISLTPVSSFMTPFLTNDPLGLTTGMFDSIKKLLASSEYRIKMINGHFISDDLKHSLIIIDTSVTLTDGTGSRLLMNYIREKLEDLPDHVKADIVAGHLHTLSNEDVIKKDIGITLSIASVSFLFLFLYVFKDIRAVLVFLIPVVAIITAIHFSSFFSKDLSAFIAAMGAVVAGIAVDYGIHVYVAVKKNGPYPRTVRNILPPLLAGALTTMTVFASFFFSRMEGYRQLAFFSIISIILCLGYSLFLLPNFIKKEETRKDINQKGVPSVFASRKIFTISVWIIFIITAFLALYGMHFDTDIKNFDGTTKDILDSEENFHATWGGGKTPGILVAEADSRDGALILNETIYNNLKDSVPVDDFFNIAPVLPSRETRLSNLEAWNLFWTGDRIKEVRDTVIRYSRGYGISDGIFNDFFDNIHENEDNMQDPDTIGLLNVMEKRYIVKNDNNWMVLSFFPDTASLTKKVSNIISGKNNFFIVSRSSISGAISKAVSSEMMYLAALSAVMVFILISGLMRNLYYSLIALIPVISGLAGVMIVVALFSGSNLNIPSVIALMVIIGLCIDYGVFILYACKKNAWDETFKAVTLSAISTLVGSGALLAAGHPVLFSIGRTLVAGVFFGYISAVFVIPAFCGTDKTPTGRMSAI